MMKKGMIIAAGALMLLSACGSYTATGAYTGGQFGNVIGSAVGGLNGGWRGHEVGSIIGTVGGTVAGAAIGSAVERSQQRKYEKARQGGLEQSRRGSDATGRRDRGYDDRQRGYDSGYDPQGRGDDRISFDSDYGTARGLEIRNIQIMEAQRDGLFTRGEELTVVFEIMNNGDRAVSQVSPLVEEVTGNKHVYISKGLLVNRIEAHQGVRYTARVLADNRLRQGEIVLRIGVAEGSRVVQSQVYDYNVPTAKR